MSQTNQTTIAGEVSLEGIGLHSGKSVHLSIKPAYPDTGYLFIASGREIPAAPAYLGKTNRSTELSNGSAYVHTVEHVLAALSGLGVDNAIIEMDAPEPPAMDGSALPFALEIEEAGIAVLEAPARFIVVDRNIVAGDEKAHAAVFPNCFFQASFILEYNHPMIGKSAVEFTPGSDTFIRDIAPARTYGFIEEVEALRKAGLALGGSEENAVVIYQDKFSSELRFPDEFVRHKLLDMMGDLALLAPARLHARAMGVRSGHALNAELVRSIVSE